MSTPLRASIRQLGLAVAGPSRVPVRAYSSVPRQLPLNLWRRQASARPSAVASASASAWASARYRSTTSTSASAESTPAGEDAASARTDQADENALRIDAPAPGAKKQKIAQLEPRLSLTFTCTANDCGHRSTHEFSKRSYTRGIVLVQCPSCKNRHLIADHLGWFKESTEEGTLKTVEDLLRAKGETVRTGKVNFDGDIEYDPEE